MVKCGKESPIARGEERARRAREITQASLPIQIVPRCSRGVCVACVEIMFSSISSPGSSSKSKSKSKKDDDFDVDEPAAPMLTPSLKLKSNMRTHRALALSKKGNEEAKDGMPSINDFVSGKLSTGEGLSKKTPWKHRLSA